MTDIILGNNGKSAIEAAIEADSGGGSFNPVSIDSDLIPATDDTYDIGSQTKSWARLVLAEDAAVSGVAIDHSGGGANPAGLQDLITLASSVDRNFIRIGDFNGPIGGEIVYDPIWFRTMWLGPSQGSDADNMAMPLLIASGNPANFGDNGDKDPFKRQNLFFSPNETIFSAKPASEASPTNYASILSFHDALWITDDEVSQNFDVRYERNIAQLDADHAVLIQVTTLRLPTRFGNLSAAITFELENDPDIFHIAPAFNGISRLGSALNPWSSAWFDTHVGFNNLPTSDPNIAGQVYSMDAAGVAAELAAGSRYLLVSNGP